MNSWERVKYAFSSDNPRGLCATTKRPGVTATQSMIVCVLVCVAFACAMLIAPFLGSWMARLFNANYNCTDYVTCPVGCFGEQAVGSNWHSCVAAGWITIMCLIVIGTVSCCLYLWIHSIRQEVREAMFPEEEGAAATTTLQIDSDSSE